MIFGSGLFITAELAAIRYFLIPLTTRYCGSTSPIKHYFFPLTYPILPAGLTEASFIQAIQSISKDGYNMVYQCYSSALYGMIVKTVRVESVAVQLFAETITDLWARINGYDAEK